jgi:hypothetical protein
MAGFPHDVQEIPEKTRMTGDLSLLRFSQAPDTYLALIRKLKISGWILFKIS